MSLEHKTERKFYGESQKEVTVVVFPMTVEESRIMFPYRPRSNYAESMFGGNNLVDDTALLLNGLAKRCKMCKAPTKLKYLDESSCPDCDGRSEYNGRNPRTSY